MNSAEFKILEHRLRQRTNSALIGRAYDMKDLKDRVEFLTWMLEICERLGLDVRLTVDHK